MARLVVVLFRWILPILVLVRFPDMVHALKPNPKTHLQEDWRILDFFSHHPEALHMFTFLFDDVGIPLVRGGFCIHGFPSFLAELLVVFVITSIINIILK